MFIITLNYNKHDTWHAYIIKTGINAFHGYCILYAKHPDKRMILTKQQVHNVIHLYHDAPYTQEIIKNGIKPIKSR